MIARGTVLGAHAGLVEVCLPATRIGDGVAIDSNGERLTGVVCALHATRAIVAVHGAIDGIARGAAVTADRSAHELALGTCALGRAIDARGRPIDGGPVPRGRRVRLDAAPVSPQRRVPIANPFWTGVRVIDGLLTFGRGARIGLFGPAGAGKSTLLEGIVDGCAADAVVVGLVGERGCEARRWIDARNER